MKSQCKQESGFVTSKVDDIKIIEFDIILWYARFEKEGSDHVKNGRRLAG